MSRIKIGYNMKQFSWGILSKEPPLYFGKNKIELQSVKRTENMIPFTVNQLQSDVGPLIGFLVSKSPNGSFIGNTKLLKELSVNLQKYGAIPFMFTAESINEEQIGGYLYHPYYKEWIHIFVPYPHVVYNRIPYRSQENRDLIEETFTIFDKQNIPIFNRHFFNKNELVHVFSRDSFLSRYHPTTLLLTSTKVLMDFLREQPMVYLKPCQSNKGKGIFTLTKQSKHRFLLKSNDSQYVFPSFSSLSNYINHTIIPKKYVIQQTISKKKVDNHPFDLRVIAHHFDNQWHVTGIGIRCGNNDKVTTHVPAGGTIVSESSLPVTIDKTLINTLITKCGGALQIHYGLIKEFSLDIGIDLDERYWIFEANSKPMVFDEPHINKKVIAHLSKALLSETPYEVYITKV